MLAFRRAGIAAALILPLAAVPCAAQMNHWDFNVNGGWSATGRALNDADLLDNTDLGNNLGLGSIGFNNDWIVGSQLGYWFNPWFGLRANFAYSDRGFSQGGLDLINNVNLWNGTGDLMVRFIRPRARFTKVEWLPYVALGAGAHWTNPAGHHFDAVDDILVQDVGVITGRSRSGEPIVCFSGVCQGRDSPGFIGIGDSAALANSRTFFLADKSTFTGLGALGMDVRLTRAFALRLEAGDRIWQSPLYRGIQRDSFLTVVGLGDRVGRTINEFYFTGGLNFLFGLVPPPTVSVVPAPPPPPQPAPPSTEEVSVCLVDPSAPGGLRTVTATHDLSTNDTTINVNGRTQRLSEVTANVPVASGSTWFVQGQPLEIGTGANALKFVPLGGGRMIEANSLSYIGNVQGMPVYADASTLGPVAGFTPGADLSQAVDQRPLIRQALMKIDVVYVPLQATGCTFQPMQMQAEVRKLPRGQ